MGYMLWKIALTLLLALLALIGAWKEWITEQWPIPKSKIALYLTVLIILTVPITVFVDYNDARQSSTRDAQLGRMEKELHESAEIIKQKDERLAELERRADTIQSLELRIQIDAHTPTRSLSEQETSAGLMSAIALFSKNGTRYRFVTDYQYSEQQIEPNIDRLSFVYRPENPRQILGEPIKFLEDMEILAVDYHNFFQTSHFQTGDQSASLNLQVFLNGVEVISLSKQESTPGVLATGQAQLNISGHFSNISATYSNIIKEKRK